MSDSPSERIVIRGAQLHNLKNLDVTIPKGRLVVLTGVSGSGKSTLAFDLLHQEATRQYLEAIGMVSYGLGRAAVGSITGLAPSISLNQNLTNHSPRSTVGTVTDVYTYLRVLFARTGLRPCPACGASVPPSYDDAAAAAPAWEAADDAASDPIALVACPHCGAALPALGMEHFSFNKVEGACPTCTGLGVVQQADLTQLVDEGRSLAAGAVRGWNDHLRAYHSASLRAAAAHYGFDFDLERPVAELPPPARDLLFFGVASTRFRRHFPQTPPPTTVRGGRFEGLATALLRRYAERDPASRARLEAQLVTQTCPDCEGARLRPESRVVTVAGRTILDLASLALTELAAWLTDLPATFTPAAAQVAAPILADLQVRLAHLEAVGAGYLSADRASPSLSAGEAQRLRLASLLGSSLSGLLYVFDEPTVGLHPRDTRRLIAVLRTLRDLGNTVLVVEHDLEVVAAADWVIDFGPGAGRGGGEIVAAGTPAQIAAAPASRTGAYLSGQVTAPSGAPRPPAQAALTLRGARLHNLRDLTVTLPLGRLVAVTGVSGSGKSTLIFDLLAPALRARLGAATDDPRPAYTALEGWQALQAVITIDQAHLSRLPRSNAATYAEVFGPIRAAFAAEPEAQRRGLSARHFSFNLPGGRCERCQGLGVLTVNMHFLPDAVVPCPTCHGRRFQPETLAVSYRGHSIAAVLDLTVSEALALFAAIPAARARLQALEDVGLGYLQLGQPATTLSGGEAQRVKLAKELGRRTRGGSLYLLDEPTTGLHPADTARLLAVLQQLVDAGHSVILVEHNLEVIRAADWLLDLGPEGGAGGGRLVAEGTPAQVAQVAASFTGQALRG